jgi:hypothetical protein
MQGSGKSSPKRKFFLWGRHIFYGITTVLFLLAVVLFFLHRSEKVHVSYGQGLVLVGACLCAFGIASFFQGMMGVIDRRYRFQTPLGTPVNMGKMEGPVTQLAIIKSFMMCGVGLLVGVIMMLLSTVAT